MMPESLERRLPLAGDVAILSGDCGLRILANTLDQDLSIQQTAAGEFQIVGNDGEMFRVNGAEPVSGPVSVTGITAGILVSLGDGNDGISIMGLSAGDSLATRLTILTGRGGDSLTLTSARIDGPVTIDSGVRDGDADADTILLSDLVLTRTLVVNTGRGDDSVEIDGVSAKIATVSTGEGADTVDLASSAAVAFDTLVVALGGGDDMVTVGSGTLELRKKRSLFSGGTGSDTFSGQGNLAGDSLTRLVWIGFEVVS